MIRIVILIACLTTTIVLSAPAQHGIDTYELMLMKLGIGLVGAGPHRDVRHVDTIAEDRDITDEVFLNH